MRSRWLRWVGKRLGFESMDDETYRLLLAAIEEDAARIFGPGEVL